jgi:hypothetical protein
VTDLAALLRRTRPSVRVVAALAALVLAGAVVAIAGGTNGHDTAASTSSKANVSGGGSAAGQGLGIGAPEPAQNYDRALVGDSAAGDVQASVAPAPVPTKLEGNGLAPAPGAKVVRTAAITLEAARRRAGVAFDRVAAVAVDRGGYVASSTRSRGDAPGGLLELRVPSDRFDDARTALAAIARVKSEEIHGEDVGGQLVDLEARLKSLQVEEQTLRSLVGQAKTVGEVLQVQPQLFDVRRQIEQIQAQHQNLDQAASFATIAVTITEKGAASPVRPPRPEPVLSRSAHTAWHAAGAVVGGMLIVVGVTAPLALLAGMLWLALRVRRRATPPGAAPIAP